jgi:UDP-N-acetylmuramate dehydrogenase
MNNRIIKIIQEQLPQNQLKTDHPLAPYTTLKIGGPADLLFMANTENELIQAVKLAQKHQIDWVILGWGSNVLISDQGFRGLVIRNQSKDIEIVGPAPKVKLHHVKSTEVDRHDFAIIHGKRYPVKFDDLDYDETHLPTQLIKVSSGFSLGHLISWSLDHGLTGLQWFNRIPGTIGGAIFNNIHGGSHYFEEYLHQITILTHDGETKTLTPDQLGLGYDQTRFHHTKDTILNATLKLYQGDVDRAKHVAMEWAKRKAIQPSNSAGCTFKNISQQDRARLGYPTTSVGYIIEWILKYSDKQIGNAKISPRHHAFIENTGKATAKDVLQLIKDIIKKTKTKTGLTLKPEIFFIGFTDEQLKGVTRD